MCCSLQVFFVIYLQDPSISPSALMSTVDPDPLMVCDLMKGKDSFLTMARERHLEFSSLRRVKYSTMVMLYELHNQDLPFLYACNACRTHVETRYHCSECEVGQYLLRSYYNSVCRIFCVVIVTFKYNSFYVYIGL